MVSCNSDADKNGSESEPEEKPFIPCDPIELSWDGERPVDTFNYPILPYMDEWKNLKTGQEMRNVCQVPLSVLEEMSTQAIIQTIWVHPLLVGDIFNDGYYQRVVESRFCYNQIRCTPINACIELAGREDAGKALLERLLLVDPFSATPRHEPQWETPWLEAQMIDIFLSQSVFLTQLNDCEKKTIVKVALKNDSIRNNNVAWANENSFSLSISKITTAILIAGTLYEAKYPPFLSAVSLDEELQFFLSGKRTGDLSFGYNWYNYYSYLYPVQDIISRIMSLGEKFMNEK